MFKALAGAAGALEGVCQFVVRIEELFVQPARNQQVPDS
jgi:hypothetical protein